MTPSYTRKINQIQPKFKTNCFIFLYLVPLNCWHWKRSCKAEQINIFAFSHTNNLFSGVVDDRLVTDDYLFSEGAAVTRRLALVRTGDFSTTDDGHRVLQTYRWCVHHFIVETIWINIYPFVGAIFTWRTLHEGQFRRLRSAIRQVTFHSERISNIQVFRANFHERIIWQNQCEYHQSSN